MRREPPTRHERGRRYSGRTATTLGLLLFACVVALAVQLAPDAGSTSFRPGLGGFVSRSSAPLYPPSDPWADYLASDHDCPYGESRTAALEVQRRAAVCLVNWARGRRGLGPLADQPLLDRAAFLKAAAISRCDNFAHAPCGEDPHAVADQVGYRGAWGENLYAGGPGAFGSARVAVDRWLNSPGHRENIFNPDWTEQGIAALPVTAFKGQRDTVIWVSHFGSS
jgi:uncharacterized protein YkwD